MNTSYLLMAAITVALVCPVALVQADTLSQPYCFEYIRFNLGYPETATFGTSDTVAESIQFGDSRSSTRTHQFIDGSEGKTTVGVSAGASAESELGAMPRASISVSMDASASSLEGFHATHVGSGFSGTSAKVAYTVHVQAVDGELYDNTVWVPLRIALGGGASVSFSSDDPQTIGYATAGASVRLWAKSHEHIRDNGSFHRGLEPGELQMGTNVSDTTSPAGAFSFNGTVDLAVGRDSTDLRVEIAAGGGGQVDAASYANGKATSSSMSANAWVDPVLQIDPDWEMADSYYLEYTPGVVQGVVPDVPEPTAITTLALGALAVLRRRRN
jgi:MYXO-CTERM domain-containing protein